MGAAQSVKGGGANSRAAAASIDDADLQVTDITDTKLTDKKPNTDNSTAQQNNSQSSSIIPHIKAKEAWSNPINNRYLSPTPITAINETSENIVEEWKENDLDEIPQSLTPTTSASSTAASSIKLKPGHKSNIISNIASVTRSPITSTTTRPINKEQRVDFGLGVPDDIEQEFIEESPLNFLHKEKNSRSPIRNN